MSGDTVIGEALQFTNDNKHAYAYSGVIGATSSGTTFLKFNTNSEYIVGTVQANYTTQSADDMTYDIIFDNVIVQRWFHAGATGVSDVGSEPQNAINVIIPPFTEVEIKITSQASTREQAVSFTGKVGMAQRVGNLDE